MSEPEYSPIDYKINKNNALNEQTTQYIQKIAAQEAKIIVAQATKKLMIAIVALLFVLVYALYQFNQTATLLENNFKKQLSEYQKRIDILEADKKK